MATYSLVGSFLKVIRSTTDYDLVDLGEDTKISDVAEVVTITCGTSNKKFEIPYASFTPPLVGANAFSILFSSSSVATTVVSAEWGYDRETGVPVFIETDSAGVTTYESPIGTPFTPIGVVEPTWENSPNLVITSVGTPNLFTTPSGCLEVNISIQGVAGSVIINGINYNAIIGFNRNFEAKVLGNGTTKLLPAITIDGGGVTAVCIDYII